MGFRSAPLLLAAVLASRADAFATRRSAPRMAFVDQLKSAVVSKFGAKKVQRVLQSLDNVQEDRLLDVEHEGLGKQEANSFIEGIGAKPWHDTADFPWCARLEENYETIRDELRAALTAEGSEKLAKDGNNAWVPAVNQDALAYGPDWRTLVLQDRSWDEQNTKLFPKTTAILRESTGDAASDVPSVEAFFARQSPGTGISPHTDFCNFILTAHLGLEIPEGDCWIQVGNEKRSWENGKTMVFDTSFMHSTANDGETDRYVLLLRVWHPELTAVERDALSFVFRAVEDPDILEQPKPKAVPIPAGASLKARRAARKKAAAKPKKGFS